MTTNIAAIVGFIILLCIVIIGYALAGYGASKEKVWCMKLGLFLIFSLIVSTPYFMYFVVTNF